MPTNNIEKHLKQTGLFWLITLTGLVAVLAVGVALYYFAYEGHDQNWVLSNEPKDYLDFGVFIGALITPLVAVVSLVIFWKTLRLQMVELVKSAKSLEQTAKANQSIVSQNERLFQLRALHEKLTKDFKRLDELEKYEMLKRGEGGELDLDRYGQYQSKLASEVLEQRDLEYLNQVNKNQKSLDELNGFANLLLMIGTDFLHYLSLGGKVHHFLEEGNKLNNLTYSVSRVFPNVEEILEDATLRSRLHSILVINEHLDQELDKNDGFLTSMVLKYKTDTDDQPRYL
ncbi:hypothetical protein [Aliidiomarina haloalkalitolerans]|uniref:Uncharacterized protein n=1 Tax=Aliidiomarina haloalkalitolerans TaxID=859059 RepID=A0A432VR55_9GAMM|nr:hypothetical protein [Aliidiomarina haloalkalitolerans]RUO18719.1 hypothetical protein CWE06_10785 [Aliidiomarina haloalkalitolerans]